ncbi:hypothetical protein N9X12_00410 [Alphaproteobacteria bacterium]|nr:hypothetical protein [Alphaproteobacteria bacterium]
MATITVSATDTAAAMDEIFQKLGDDALILETANRNGKIEMVATNDAAQRVKVRASKAPKKAPAFTELFDQKLVQEHVEGTHQDDANIATDFALKALAKNQSDDKSSPSDIAAMRKDMAILKSMMSGMMITDENGLSEKLGHSTTIKLRQAGFSPEIVSELQYAFEGQSYEKGRLSFMNELARQLIRPKTEDLFEARLICVVGSSGSGKTTLATKIAAHCKETGIANNMILGTVTSERLAGETIKDHARLMNMPSVDFPLEELSTRVKETSRRMIMDVSAQPDQAVAAIRKATAALDPARVAVVQAIPGGSSSVMIAHQCKLYKQLAPTIALTKLDECEATPPELCSLLTHGNGIGLLTGTKSIVGGIAIATDAILAQYLKENC